METQQLAEDIQALSAHTRTAIELLVLVLNEKQLVPASRQPPILSPADSAYFGAWADRLNIVDGANYIHQVQRGQRPA